MIKRGELNTEQQNPSSEDIGNMDVSTILKIINKEDLQVIEAVKAAIPEIETAVNFTIESVKNNGRVFYVGAGTSGRLGVLDASEIPPTFSARKNLFIGIIAGGDDALKSSIEGAEDDRHNAIIDLEPYQLNENDVLIGISCSGAASYVIAALDYARTKGTRTIYLVMNPTPYFNTDVDLIIKASTGSEIIAGSTRMKAGSATKMILNMISTVTMIKLGKVYKNLMVDLMAVNEKLIDRGTRIIANITGLDYQAAQKKLNEANGSVKLAIVMHNKNCNHKQACKILKDSDGFLGPIIDEL